MHMAGSSLTKARVNRPIPDIDRVASCRNASSLNPPFAAPARMTRCPRSAERDKAGIRIEGLNGHFVHRRFMRSTLNRRCGSRAKTLQPRKPEASKKAWVHLFAPDCRTQSRSKKTSGFAYRSDTPRALRRNASNPGCSFRMGVPSRTL